jgi:hypothetical protein
VYPSTHNGSFLTAGSSGLSIGRLYRKSTRWSRPAALCLVVLCPLSLLASVPLPRSPAPPLPRSPASLPAPAYWHAHLQTMTCHPCRVTTCLPAYLPAPACPEAFPEAGKAAFFLLLPCRELPGSYIYDYCSYISYMLYAAMVNHLGLAIKKGASTLRVGVFSKIRVISSLKDRSKMTHQASVWRLQLNYRVKKIEHLLFHYHISPIWFSRPFLGIPDSRPQTPDSRPQTRSQQQRPALRTCH